MRQSRDWVWMTPHLPVCMIWVGTENRLSVFFFFFSFLFFKVFLGRWGVCNMGPGSFDQSSIITLTFITTFCNVLLWLCCLGVHRLWPHHVRGCCDALCVASSVMGLFCVGVSVLRCMRVWFEALGDRLIWLCFSPCWVL
ncbi:uncharacterized protein B0H64DRAFT_73073 [Chaetomium fimeti]|uniref:Uncharacterized protein n=1 Tax=Chaetomium fimeti TaxID=1854472 RepID=A0AAE0HKU3_9PEZI|nr:hypothetical protein B0H64DRAFT_73073 [Chaetomium fimeti]